MSTSDLAPIRPEAVRGKDQLLYERRNGRFVLQITGHPEFGVPFGQDRLVPLFPATLAVQQKSQTIRFRTAAEILESFGMHTGGNEYRRVIGACDHRHGCDPNRLVSVHDIDEKLRACAGAVGRQPAPKREIARLASRLVPPTLPVI